MLTTTPGLTLKKKICSTRKKNPNKRRRRRKRKRTMKRRMILLHHLFPSQILNLPTMLITIKSPRTDQSTLNAAAASATALIPLQRVLPAASSSP